MDYLRRNLRWEDIEDVMPGLEGLINSKEDIAAIHAVIRDGLTFEAAGRRLGVGGETVKKHAMRGCCYLLMAILGRPASHYFHDKRPAPENKFRGFAPENKSR